MTEKDWWDKLTQRPLIEWIPFKGVALLIVAFTIMFVVGVLKWPTDSTIFQWGYRGTGMAQIYEQKAWDRALATVDAIPPSYEPYEAMEGDVLAGEVYENVQVLGHVTEDNFLRLMTAITEWVAPEQGCAYCHNEENYAEDNVYTKIVARRMIQMNQTINAEWTDHVGYAGVNCWTCHRGNNVPEYIWYEEEPQQAGLIGWRNNQNMPNPRVASSSLPSNVFERFLVEDNEIRVTWPESRGGPTADGVKGAEWTFGLMMHMSTALNVNCAYCHNTRAFNEWSQSPPQRTTAWYGIRMVRDLNNYYLDPLQPVYPDYRLGVMGDAPKANCATCHQGVYKPLFGQPMIDDWPELVGGTPAVEEVSMDQASAD